MESLLAFSSRSGRLIAKRSFSSAATRLRPPRPCHHLRQSCRAQSTKVTTPISNQRPNITKTFIYSSYALFTTVTLAAGLFAIRPAHAEALSNPDDSYTPRKIRLQEVSKHDQHADTYWIIRGTRVYDITDWVPNHPGGEVILRAAGGVVDRYWDIFSIHQKQDVYDILEQYFIGIVDPKDLVNGKVPSTNVDDPFKTDPSRDERLEVHTERPCNAETPASDLGDFITPNNVFYVRNHLWVPQIDSAENHKLTIELYDGTETTYTISDLRQKFPETTITALLQCSGNRRAHMNEKQPTSGLPWKIGAIGNAHWTGVRLRDVLADAGFDVNNPDEDVQHAQFTGAEAYGASIPIDKAIDCRGDVLLAYAMNGQPIPRDHGFPLRVIVPGTVAARSVKWVKKISLSDEESPAQWQRRDYKCFCPSEKSDTADWEAAQAIQETPVQSAITNISLTSPKNPLSKRNEPNSQGEKSLLFEGYAYSGGGRRIIRIDISPDNGATWRPACLLSPLASTTSTLPQQTSSSHHLDTTLSHGSRSWSWQRWSCTIAVEDIKGGVYVKATDQAYCTQPEGYDGTWNFRGNLANAWEKIGWDSVAKRAGLVDGKQEQANEGK